MNDVKLLEDGLIDELVAKTLEYERGAAHDQSMPKSRRQNQLFDALDRLLNESWAETKNDN